MCAGCYRTGDAVTRIMEFFVDIRYEMERSIRNIQVAKSFNGSCNDVPDAMVSASPDIGNLWAGSSNL